MNLAPVPCPTVGLHKPSLNADPVVATPDSSVPFDLQALTQHVLRWWGVQGNSWHEPASTRTLLTGVAKLAWRCARIDDAPMPPPFAVTLASWPRCIRILLPDNREHFGAVIVWLRHFEALLPAGAPPCHLVLAQRLVQPKALPESIWLWGCANTGRPDNTTNATQHSAG